MTFKKDYDGGELKESIRMSTLTPKGTEKTLLGASDRRLDLHVTSSSVPQDPFDYREPAPSFNYEEAQEINTQDIHTRILYLLHALTSHPQSPKRTSSQTITATLRLWTNAAAATTAHGSHAIQSTDWKLLADATTLAAPSMSLPQVSQLLCSLAAALHRCGPKLDPSASMLQALAKAACNALKQTQCPGRELIAFQAAVADVLQVAALGARAGSRKTRRAWAQRVAAHTIPALAVGIGAVHSATKIAAIDAVNDTTATSHEQTVHSALFIAQALAPMACCPVSVPGADILSSPSTQMHTSRNAWWHRAAVLLRGPRCGAVAPEPAQKELSGDRLSSMLLKLHGRALAVSEWLENSLAPAAIPHMTRRQLDTFASALEAAAGDGSLCQSPPPRAHDVLLRCAALALEEAAWRVSQPQAALGPSKSFKVEHARRMAATARRNLDLIHGSSSPKAADVASAAATLEHFIDLKEQEEAAELMASMAAAVAASVMQEQPQEKPLSHRLLVT